MSLPNLLAVYSRTPAGDAELASPSHGLSINQRKLLQWADGQGSLSEMAERLAAGHTVDAGKVSRDIERLEALGLIVSSEAGTRGAAPAAARQQANKSKLPLVLAGVGAIVVAGGLFAFLGNKPAPVAAPKQLAAADNAAEPAAQEDAAAGSSGIMPNPARWFSPAAPKPAEPTPALVDPKAATKTEPAATAKLAATPAAANANPVAPAPVPAQATAQPVAKPTPAPIQAAPVPAPAPVQVAAAPVAAPVALPPPNTKPIFSFQPDFPSEAARNGIESGVVRVRLSVDEKGQVVKVDIVDAKPRQVFDKAVIAALSKWRFQPYPNRFSVETEVEFRDN